MKGSIRRKGKAWSYRVYVSTVDGQNKQRIRNSMARDIKETLSPKELNEIKKTILRQMT